MFISHSVATGLPLHCCAASASFPLRYHGPPAAFYRRPAALCAASLSLHYHGLLLHCGLLHFPSVTMASHCILRDLPLHCALLHFPPLPRPPPALCTAHFLPLAQPPAALCAASFPSARVPFTYKALGTHAGHRKCELNEHRRDGAGVMAQSGGSYHNGGLCLGGRDWQIPGAHCQPACLNHQVLGKSKRPSLKKQSGQ